LTHILLVEDELGLVLTIADRLRSEGYQVTTATDGEEGFERASTEPFDLLILDVMMPRKSGFEVCQELREQGFSMPILMLTARGQTADKVQGLKIGADDYLTKPFDMLELLARIEALLRRPPVVAPATGNQATFGDIRVDQKSTEVTRAGEHVQVSALEFQLLCYFVEHRGETLSRQKLLNEVWGYRAVQSTRTVDVHVAWLRQKLEPDPKRPQYILTVHGLGYKFQG
jgi:two-component system, OmpR family, alkaline phosphatase synthesis response regulator PhoP